MIKKEYDAKYYTDINNQSLTSMSSKYDKFVSYLGKDISPKSIVDLGCGSGTLCAYLKNKYPESEIIGVDASIIPIEIAQQRYQNMNFITCDINNDKLPIRSDSVDLVVLHEVIEHLKSLDNCLAESFRILKKQGAILIKTPNGLDFMRLICRLFGRIWYADLDKTHIKYYDIFTGKKELKNNLFVNIKCYTGTRPLIKKNIFYIPALPVFGHGLVLVGKKGGIGDK